MGKSAASMGEFARCTCGAWARIWRGEKGYRDRMVCSTCGSVTVCDTIVGQQLRLKEVEVEVEITDNGEDDFYG